MIDLDDDDVETTNNTYQTFLLENAQATTTATKTERKSLKIPECKIKQNRYK